jgi:hypothetical protein
MAGYVPIEFPKWVGDLLVNNAEEEAALRAALAKPASADRADGPVRLLSSAGIRMRRTRQRRQEGRQIVSLDLSAAQIEALVMAGYLDPVLRDDAAEVARGVGRMLDRAAKSVPVAPLATQAATTA